LLVDKK